jgi:ABC-type multidrug transport system fused ATPase/permease subunit
MQSLGSPKSSSHPAKGGFSMFRISGPGLMVLVTAFVVAVIFAANQNDVVGWVVAVIALFWLLLASFVVFSIQKAAKKAGAKLSEAHNAFNAAAGRAPSSVSTDQGGTRLVRQRGEAEEIRDMKLDHSFKIVQVQVRVVEQERAKGAAADQDTIRRALETIEITATNARDMIKSSGDSGEPVTGTIID